MPIIVELPSRRAVLRHIWHWDTQAVGSGKGMAALLATLYAVLVVVVIAIAVGGVVWATQPHRTVWVSAAISVAAPILAFGLGRRVLSLLDRLLHVMGGVRVVPAFTPQSHR